MKKKPLRFIEDGNDDQALSKIDVEADSLCGVSIVRGDNLVTQAQTAVACEIIKNDLSDRERYDKHQRPNHARE